MTDEDVIKRRLLIDGDGTGDDRRLNVLLKTFIKLCSTNESAENNQIMYDRLLAQLAQCEFAAVKSGFASIMIKQELENYETISETIESSIELVKNEIECSKEGLVLAKKIRKNRMEYDVLAKVINSQPDRKETMGQLEILRKELKSLEDKKLKLQCKLNARKNDFFILMRAITDLRPTLEEESMGESDEMDNMMVDERSDYVIEIQNSP